MYQVIARKYRPQTFDEVVSQDHIKQTLRNALESDRVAHGYIFAGPRGTGKTTMARIMAMALNCTDGPSASPDPTDPICREIAAGSAMDVIEIDAASNRRIDDIRELRESVKYRPARDRYKVFIIDEAHQITSDAFNALLKTLEEPPEWVVFILCTTEPQAIPATILSRCQSFQFRTVDLDMVVGYMRGICEREGVEAEDDALVTVALAGDGSIRDSLSTLDQAIASCGRKLEAAAVRDLLGAIPSEVTGRIVDALRDQDAPAMLEIVDRVFCEGRDPQQFCGELSRFFRNLLVMKVSGADTKLVAAGTSERDRASASIEAFSEEDLTRYVQLTLDLYRDLQAAVQPRFRLELGLLKLVYVGKLRPIEEAIASIGGGGSKLAPATPSMPPPAPPPPAPPAAKQPQASPPAPTTAPSPPPEPPPKPAPEPPGASSSKSSDGPQAALAAALNKAGEDWAASAIEHSQVSLENGKLIVRATPADRTTLEFAMSALEAAAGPGTRVTLGDDLAETEQVKSVPAPSQAAAESGPDTGTEVAKRALADPAVQAFQERFPGQVREIRNLRD